MSALTVEEAARILRAGGLVAFPTETVYGLGADGLSAPAVARIFEAKGRPPDNPLILHVADVETALSLWRTDAQQAERVRQLAEAFWPGPLTLVLPAAEIVPGIVRAGLDTVGVRVPDHPVALALLRAVDGPLAAPSANASGRPSPTRAEHVTRTLAGRIDGVLDGGATRVGLESTVLDLSGDPPRILRPGAVAREELEAVLGIAIDADAGAAAARSPGTRHAHYVPAGIDASLVDSDAIEAAWPGDAALLCRAGTADACRARLGARSAPLEVLPDDAAAYASGFYAALYRLERCGARTLLMEAVPADDAWLAVRDRLQRAAGQRDG